MISLGVERNQTPETRAPKRNTKLKGDVSELRVAAALIETGYAVSKPFGENQRYDLVIDDGENLARVQVKTGRLRNGVVLFNCSSTHGHRGRPARPYRGEVEYIAVYCPDTGKVYFVPEAHFTNSYGSLRVLPTKNNVAKTVRWASAFELA
ncbi:MAG: hypothetical protein JO036_04505 [Candidatus Eremiobacteraeota bacterium]|nr:hypothetical protein [Candidatus Eremiobacteraeota bacterium]